MTAFVLTLPCDGASATLLSPSLVCIVDPDATVPDPGPGIGGRSPIDDTFEAGIPESFNVLVKEMRSLGLNVELTSSKKAANDQLEPPADAAE